MKTTFLTFFVFNNTYYIPTPAEHELGSHETEPVAIIPIHDHVALIEALQNRFHIEPTKIKYEDAKKIGFVSKKFTGHKSVLAFVKAVDCWQITAESYGSTDYFLTTMPKKERGGFSQIENNPIKLELGDLIHSEIDERRAAFTLVAEYIDNYYNSK